MYCGLVAAGRDQDVSAVRRHASFSGRTAEDRGAPRLCGAAPLDRGLSGRAGLPTPTVRPNSLTPSGGRKVDRSGAPGRPTAASGHGSQPGVRRQSARSGDSKRADVAPARRLTDHHEPRSSGSSIRRRGPLRSPVVRVRAPRALMEPENVGPAAEHPLRHADAAEPAPLRRSGTDARVDHALAPTPPGDHRVAGRREFDLDADRRALALQPGGPRCSPASGTIAMGAAHSPGPFAGSRSAASSVTGSRCPRSSGRSTASSPASASTW